MVVWYLLEKNYHLNNDVENNEGQHEEDDEIEKQFAQTKILIPTSVSISQ